MFHQRMFVLVCVQVLVAYAFNADASPLANAMPEKPYENKMKENHPVLVTHHYEAITKTYDPKIQVRQEGSSFWSRFGSLFALVLRP